MPPEKRLAIILEYAEGRMSARDAKDILNIDETEFNEVLDEYQLLPPVFPSDDEDDFYEARELPTEFEISTAVFEEVVEEPAVFTIH